MLSRRSRTNWLLLQRTVTEPKLFDIAVGHAGDVVGYGAGEAFSRDLDLVVGRKQTWIGNESREQLLQDVSGALVFFFHSR